MRYAIPGGIVAGAATFTTYLLARHHYTGEDALAAETSAATLTLFLVSLWVLAIIARPYTWWRLASSPPWPAPSSSSSPSPGSRTSSP
ncbi:hypothetical protein STANM309S_06139 [Streptomyces tanashiensis]